MTDQAWRPGDQANDPDDNQAFLVSVIEGEPGQESDAYRDQAGEKQYRVASTES